MAAASLQIRRQLSLTRRLLYTAVSSISYIDKAHDFVSPSPPNTEPTKTHLQNSFNILEINSTLKYLVKNGQLNAARKLFDEMPRPDEISWTTIISGYINSTDPVEALSLFSKMWVLPGLRMDPFVLSLAVKACAVNLSVGYGESLHGYSVKTCFIDSVFVGSAVMDMYMKVGRVELGCKVFDEMQLRNVVTWTAVITGLVRSGYRREGLAYFAEMWRSKVVCDSYTYAIALKACADAGTLDHGREIHCVTIKRGVDGSSYVANTLVTMYNKCGKLDYGSCLFERIDMKDVVTWTMVIATYDQLGQEENAIDAFLRMRETGVSPNEFTFAAVISSCASLGRIGWGEQLHGQVLRLGMVDSLSVANSIMTLYAKNGQLDLASMVFRDVTKPDIISWSTIISGYSQGGCAEEAFEYFSWMRRDGPRPTEFSLSSLLSVCGNMAILEQGKQLHSYTLRVGLEQTAMIQSALINMYSKSGSITEAAKVLDEAQNVDIVSWTAIINGYAEHGYVKEVFELFEKITGIGLRPDAVTFIGVLTACSHAGLVDLAFHYFNSMHKEYRISPWKEHYGCMIDLLCRAGRLSEAEDMISSMPFQQDDVVWSTLLRACRVHGDADRGRRAAEKILKLDPDCAGTHITLANIYSAKGKWSEAAEIRKMMKSKGVIKEPGWAWIKVKDQVTQFVAGDQSHQQSEDIYGMLDFIVSGQELSSDELDHLQSLVGE